MTTFYPLILWLHIGAGSAGLLFFWQAMLCKKGSPRHRRAGRYFSLSMQTTAFSALALSAFLIIDPNSTASGYMLLTLGLLLLNNTSYAVAVLKAAADRNKLKTPRLVVLSGALALCGLVLGTIAIQHQNLLFGIFAGISLMTVLMNNVYIYRAKVTSKQWILEHISNILAAGIATHTAFFVVGAARLFSLPETMQIVPWLAPSVLGTLAIVGYSVRYRRGDRRIGTQNIHL